MQGRKRAEQTLWDEAIGSMIESRGWMPDRMCDDLRPNAVRGSKVELA